MGRLSGFRYRDVVKRLKRFGFAFDRQAAGSHEIWYQASGQRYTTIPNHPGDLPEGTLRAILRQAGVSVDDFLSHSFSVLEGLGFGGFGGLGRRPCESHSSVQVYY
ncbi:hypothetical protein SynWH8101_0256 [Synechococcus sp. WH 8101]|uniref:type II toxin-antitoxin system HicA family toxin n=1 Tax=Synechococcus sp. WH 8101 TaxID=59932 RepID=UPI0010237707|nr:type II toxin-antitoxin system HicA family toxin [Synechococcus sp. WH 8101]QBE67868.1 hypothetical protein SynWH8101_0256 [Synechococcus sp. WH 8101]QNI44065.1 YcfA-like family protein [Synechococcus sp. WH 8101]